MTISIAKSTVILNDLTAKFDAGVLSYTPLYNRICLTNPSNRDTEKYAMMGSLPGVREFLGDRQFQELSSATYELKNKTWESSLLIDRHNMADDWMGMYGPVLQQLGLEASAHPDELLFDPTTGLLTLAESTVGWDGQFHIDTDHVWGDSGAGGLSNDITGPNLVTDGNPTAAEAKLMFNVARVKMLSYKNDKGKYLNRAISSQQQLAIICNPLAEQGFREAVSASTVSTGGVNVTIDAPQILVTPYCATNKWYLVNLSSVARPFIFQARSPLQRQMKDATDIEQKNIKFMTKARYNMGFGAWWTIVLTTTS